jgi:hypothetical protein
MESLEVSSVKNSWRHCLQMEDLIFFWDFSRICFSYAWQFKKRQIGQNQTTQKRLSWFVRDLSSDANLREQCRCYIRRSYDVLSSVKSQKLRLRDRKEKENCPSQGLDPQDHPFLGKVKLNNFCLFSGAKKSENMTSVAHISLCFIRISNGPEFKCPVILSKRDHLKTGLVWILDPHCICIQLLDLLQSY